MGNSISMMINIGAKVGGMMSSMNKAQNSVTKLGAVMQKMDKQKLDIIANDASVLKAKSSLDLVSSKLENLKKTKAKLSLELDKNKVSGINATLSKVKSELKTLESKERKIEFEIKATTDEKELKKLNKSLATTRKKILDISSKKIGLYEELEKTKEANEKVNEKLRRTDSIINKLKSKKLTLTDELKSAKQEALGTNKTLLNMHKTIEKINGTKLKIKQTVERRERFKQSAVSNVARVASVIMPIKTGIEFESSMARVKAITMATDTQFKALESTALKLGSSTTFSSSEVAKGMQYLSMAGFKTNETIKAMPGVLNLASAGALDLASTSDIASNVLSGFNIKAGKMGMVADVMAKATTNSNLGISELGATMKNAAPAASSLGASVQEVTALAGKLADVGIKGGDSGTALKIMFLRMASPPKQAQKVIADLGLQTKNAQGNFIGMTNLLGQLHKKTQGMTNVKKSDYMKKLFGSEAIGASLKLTEKADGTLSKYVRTLENSAGHAQKMADIQNATTVGALKALSSAIEGIAIKFSKMFTPAITYASKKLSAVSGWIGKMMDAYPKLTSFVSVGAVAVLAGGVALATLGVMAGFAMNGIRMLRLGLLLSNTTMLVSKSVIVAKNITLKLLTISTVLYNKALIGLKLGWAIAKTLALKGVVLAKAGAFKIATIATKLYNSALKGLKLGWVIAKTLALKGVVLAKAGAFKIATIATKLYNSALKGLKLGWVIAKTLALKGVVLAKAGAFKIATIATKLYNSALKGLKLGWVIAKTLALKGVLLAKSLALGTATIAVKAYGLASSLAVGGVKMLGRTIAFVGRAMLMNPIVLAVTAIAGGAYLIYSNWDMLSNWFSSFWSGIKGIFSSTWEGIKTLFSWSPFGVISANWQPILNFIGGVGDGIKNLFGLAWNGLKTMIAWNPVTFVSEKWNGLMNFFSNFSLKEAGSKIITSVIDGISATWQKLVKKVGGITKSIRDFFPFSPAKKGALADIHKIKLMETVASGLNEKPLLKAVNNTTGKMRKSLALAGAGVALGGSLAVAEPISPYPSKSLVPNVTSSLPALQNRTFNTLENLKLNSMNSVKDRSFKTKEHLISAKIPKTLDRTFSTKENALENGLPTLADRVLSKENGTMQPAQAITVNINMGDVVVKSEDGKIVDATEVETRFREIATETFVALKNDSSDRDFGDMGEMG